MRRSKERRILRYENLVLLETEVNTYCNVVSLAQVL